ncbi:MAG TPA: amidase family protein, partial [Candidatus Elarobacter sp.]
DLSVIGPLARSAADLALALDILAGPNDLDAAGYRLELPPPRCTQTRGARVLILDQHPEIATAASIRTMLDRVASELEREGALVARGSPLLPDLARGARIFAALLFAAMAPRWPKQVIDELRAAATALPRDDDSVTGYRLRGATFSHGDWLLLDGERFQRRIAWKQLFREFDVVIAPPMPTPAFPHDHEPDFDARRIAIDGADYPYGDMSLWAAVATEPGLPATTVPIERTADGLPIGVQIIGPYLEDRTPLAFADLMERIFGGFVAPEAFV